MFNYFNNIKQKKTSKFISVDEFTTLVSNFNAAFFARAYDKYETLGTLSHNGDMMIERIGHSNYVYYDEIPLDQITLGSARYSQEKMNLPVVVLNSFSSVGSKRLSDDRISTGFMYFDIDAIESIDLRNAVKHKLVERFPFVYACWTSVSGKGVGFIVKCLNIDQSSYAYNFETLCKSFNEELLHSCGLEIDPACMGYVKPTFISFDPHILINRKCTTYEGHSVGISISVNSSTSSSLFLGCKSIYRLSKNENIEKLVNNRNVYYSIYRRYVNSVENVEELRLTVESMFEGTVCRGTYSTLTEKDDGIYDACEKLPYLNKIYFNKNIPIGKRNKMIGLLGMKLIFNNPFINPHSLLRTLLFMNKRYMEEPLQEKEVRSSFQNNYSKYLDGSLDFNVLNPRFKYGFFNKGIEDVDSRQHDVKKGKQLLGIWVYNKNVHGNKVKKIEKAIDELADYSGRITAKKICKITGIKSDKTVRTYLKRYPRLKEKIEEHNELLPKRVR